MARMLDSRARKFGVAAGVAALALVVTACSSSGTSAKSSAGPTSAAGSATGGSGKVVDVTVSLPAITGDAIPVAIANAQNIWQKYGLDVKVVSVTTTVQFTSLATGDADIAIGSAGGLSAAAKGAPVRVIGTLGPAYTAFVTKSSITKPADLKGKKLGASAPGSTFQAAQNIYLSQHGLQSNQFTTVFFAGSFASAVSAMDHGQLDGLIAAPPFLYQLQANTSLHQLARIDQTNVGVITANVLTVNTNWAKQNAYAIGQFVKAWRAAIAALSTPAGRTTAIQALATGSKLSTADATDWFDKQLPELAVSPISDGDLALLREAYGPTAPEVKTAPASTLIDNSYISGA